MKSILTFLAHTTRLTKRGKIYNWFERIEKIYFVLLSRWKREPVR